MFENMDLANNVLRPRQADDIGREVGAKLSRSSPYTFMAAIALPNYIKASTTLARNQTLANEALVACALERYRLAHGQYPETLAALVPQFADKLPHDIINGQPLKYHRTEDGGFILYSVGWNEADDGGVPGKSNSEGDWVWRDPAHL